MSGEDSARQFAKGSDIAQAQGEGAQATIIKVNKVEVIYQPGPVFSRALDQLRAPTTDFVGREAELDRLVQALSQAAGGQVAAISCVRGLGGIGKTELAYAVAHRLAPVFPDARLFIELRGASDSPVLPAQALQKVVRAFQPLAKLPDDIGELQALYRSQLSGKRVLILADDARDAAQVRPLIPPAGCALLITSRQRFPLPGMVPLELECLEPEEAERLLLTICPRIAGAAHDLAKLCGYLPLALRVSAGLLQNDATIHVEQYLQRLKDEQERLALLRDPDDPTLDVKTVLNLSYALLDANAQVVFRQISVFPTSFDRAAAEDVVELPTNGDAEARAACPSLDTVLSRLYRCSLVEWDKTVERYRLHDLVRLFADRYLHPPMREIAQRRHADHYLALAEMAERELSGKKQIGWLDRLDQEHDNLRAALRWALAQETAETAMRLGAALWRFWDLHNHQREGLVWLESILRSTSTVLTATRAKVLHGAGSFAWFLGDYERARELHEESLKIYQTLEDSAGIAHALLQFGVLALYQGDYAWAETRCQESLERFQKLGDNQGMGRSLIVLGVVAHHRANYAAARLSLEKSLELFQELGDREYIALALLNLGSVVLSQQHNYTEACSLLEESLRLYQELGDQEGIAWSYTNLGDIAQYQGDYERAKELFEKSLELWQQLGSKHGTANSLTKLGYVAQYDRDYGRAAALFRKSLPLFRELEDKDGLTWCLKGLAAVAGGEGRSE